MDNLERDYASEAAALGHVPKEDWRGDPDKWTDAKTFVEQAEKSLPALRRTNQVLHTGMAQMRQDMAALVDELRTTKASLKVIEDSYEEDLKERVEAAKRDIKERLKKAKEDDNVDQEVELTDQLQTLNAESKEAERKAKEKKTQAETQQPPRIDAATQAWMAANMDIVQDPTKAPLVQAHAMLVRARHPELASNPAALYAELDKTLIKEGIKKGNAPAESKVGESTRSSGGGEGSGNSDEKGYADLPADAKAACTRLAERFVGEGKAHKTLKSWQDAYAKRYHAQT